MRKRRMRKNCRGGYSCYEFRWYRGIVKGKHIIAYKKKIIRIIKFINLFWYSQKIH